MTVISVELGTALAAAVTVIGIGGSLALAVSVVREWIAAARDAPGRPPARR